jgi:predicted nucleotidyltransferase
MSFYIDDSSAEDVRPTKDVDLSLEIVSISDLEKIRENLIMKGFYQSAEDSVICRFRYEDIKVDVMSTKEIGWAPANPWFAPGFKNLIRFKIDEIEIRCLSIAYYLATKFTAFYDRGSKDPRFSHDFEDIVYLLNYTNNLVDEVLHSDAIVQDYLKGCFRDILEDRSKQEAILCNLYYDNQDKRYKKIIDKLNLICFGVC